MLDWPESFVSKSICFLTKGIRRYVEIRNEFDKLSVRSFSHDRGKAKTAAYSILNEETKKSVQPRTSSWERSFHSRVQTWSERKLVWKCDIPDSSRKLIESMTRGNIIVIQYYRFRRLSYTLESRFGIASIDYLIYLSWYF